jgi:hypothetical protein
MRLPQSLGEAPEPDQPEERRAHQVHHCVSRAHTDIKHGPGNSRNAGRHGPAPCHASSPTDKYILYITMVLLLIMFNLAKEQ